MGPVGWATRVCRTPVSAVSGRVMRLVRLTMTVSSWVCVTPQPGDDVGLDLDGLVAVTSQEQKRVEPMPSKETLDEIGGAAVVRPAPGVEGEVGGSHR
jgi:hypothetical protein